MNITEWFDIKNIEHVKAYKILGVTGSWPEGFIPDHIEFQPTWSILLMMKFTEAFLELILDDTKGN